jgi:hypothetical protein
MKEHIHWNIIIPLPDSAVVAVIDSLASDIDFHHEYYAASWQVIGAVSPPCWHFPSASLSTLTLLILIQTRSSQPPLADHHNRRHSQANTCRRPHHDRITLGHSPACFLPGAD